MSGIPSWWWVDCWGRPPVEFWARAKRWYAKTWWQSSGLRTCNKHQIRISQNLLMGLARSGQFWSWQKNIWTHMAIKRPRVYSCMSCAKLTAQIPTPANCSCLMRVCNQHHMKGELEVWLIHGVRPHIVSKVQAVEGKFMVQNQTMYFSENIIIRIICDILSCSNFSMQNTLIKFQYVYIMKTHQHQEIKKLTVNKIEF